MLKKIVFKTLFILITLITCNANQTNQTRQVDWAEVIDAIIHVESRGDTTAISSDGKFVGPMQIHKVVVDDCNQYLKMKKSNIKFTYDDRFNLQKSKQMFYLIQQRYNKTNDVEKAIRIWNGGPNGHKRKATLNYYNKVVNQIKKD